jgi:hypothetical protein
MKKIYAFLLATALLLVVSNVTFAQLRAGAGQAAITDSTTGTAGATATAGTGVQTISIPLDLSSLANGNVNPTAYTLGYKFKILSATFAVNKPATTGAKASTLTLKIGSTAVTGFSIALTSANCTPTGNLVPSSAITAANTGTASDTITLVAGSTTAFVEGTGELLLTVQNMDTADAHASELRMLNEIRGTLINRLKWKGGP